MQTKYATRKLTTAAILIAMGIAIPMFMPLRIVIDPASYTLASHVPIFLSMFISPSIAVMVSIGATIGFLFGGFPIVVVLRAASHLIFVIIGALILRKRNKSHDSNGKIFLFGLIIAVIHAISETLVVSAFYLSGNVTYEKGFVYSVLLLVGLGTIIHSMIDYYISLAILKTVSKNKFTESIFVLNPYNRNSKN